MIKMLFSRPDLIGLPKTAFLLQIFFLKIGEADVHFL